MTHPDRYPDPLTPQPNGPNVVGVFVILCVICFLVLVAAGLVWLVAR